MPSPRVHFIMPVPSQPRFHKRIAGFEALGAEAKLYAFERDYFKGKTQTLSYRSLGRLQHGSYGRRLPALLGALPVLWRSVRRHDILYCFGLDTALLGAAVKRLRGKSVRLVYECGDITAIMVGKGRASRAMRWAERQVLAVANQIVITSPEFGAHYFAPVQGASASKLFVIENKLDFTSPPAVQAMGAEVPGAECCAWDGSRPLRLGYFGLLRDLMAWQIMLAWAQQTPDRLQIDVRGYPFGIDPQDIDRSPNISFGGEYVHPDDLPGLYGGVDLVWVTYPKPQNAAADRRWQWPRTNRFYEACFFGRPMIGQTGSADGALIEAHDIGVTIDTADPAAAIDRLLAIRPADIVRWTVHLRQLPTNAYVLTDEHQRLLAALI